MTLNSTSPLIKGNKTFTCTDLNGCDYKFFAYIGSNRSNTGQGIAEGYPLKITVLPNAKSEIVDNDTRGGNTSTDRFEYNAAASDTEDFPGYYLSSKLFVGKATDDQWAKWRPSNAGKYRVFVHIPSKIPNAGSVTYKVVSGGTTKYMQSIDHNYQSDSIGTWKQLTSISGETEFTLDNTGYVGLFAGEKSGGNSSNSDTLATGKRAAADAVKFIWVGSVSTPQVTYPTASGVTWYPGSSYNITWSGFTGGNVKIELYKGSSLNRTITSSTSNDGSHSWTVPSNQTTGTDYRIKVTSTTTTSQSDYSDNYFQIAKSGNPSNVSVNPASGSWTSSPQNLNVSSNGATTIYYTMVNTYDGSTPADPPAPTPSSNNGSLGGPSAVFQLYASAGQYMKSKLRFVGCNSVGCGPASGSFSYTLDLRTAPGSVSVNPASGSWTTSPRNLNVSSNGATTIYYTMVNTYNGSTPADPPTPSPSSNNGSLNGSSAMFELYASAGQHKRSKLRFVGCNSLGCGPATGSYLYAIDLHQPNYEGWIDDANCTSIWGWAWDTYLAETPINVDIYDGGSKIATVSANQFRQDLLNAGKGNGYHGFTYSTPSSLRDGNTHTVYVKYGGTSSNLNGSPKTLTCAGYASVSQGLNVSPTPVKLGQNFTISFTLRETRGMDKTFESVAIAIIDPSGNFIFDFVMYNSITVPANGKKSFSAQNYIYSSRPSGTYKAVARGKPVGGNWFDFDTVDSGVNPRSFSVVK